MSHFIEIDHLSKAYQKGVYAVNDITIGLPKGKIIGLLGPNGSGKTTLIKMINGLLTPNEGTIKIAGVEVGPYTKSMVSYLPDRTYLDDNKKILDHLKMFEDFYKDFDMGTALGLLSDLNLDPNQKLKHLSKGNKEKVQLILVMSRRAQLYVLDEPIAGVDPAARDYILETIIQNRNPESSVIISTHLIGDVENYLDEVIFMKYGHLILYSDANSLREKYGKTVDEHFREVFSR